MRQAVNANGLNGRIAEAKSPPHFWLPVALIRSRNIQSESSCGYENALHKCRSNFIRMRKTLPAAAVFAIQLALIDEHIPLQLCQAALPRYLTYPSPLRERKLPHLPFRFS